MNTPRSDLLQEAETLVNGERNDNYGDPNDDFKATADLWNAYLSRLIAGNGGYPPELQPHDIAAMMIMLKLSRIAWSPNKYDSWVDIAGYAACGWDCATNNQ